MHCAVCLAEVLLRVQQHLGSLVRRNIICGIRGLLMVKVSMRRTGVNTFTFDPFPNPLEVYLGSSHFLIKFICFQLEDTCFMILCWFLAYISMKSVTGIHMSFPPEPPSPELINCTSRLCHLLTWNFPNGWSLWCYLPGSPQLCPLGCWNSSTAVETTP